MPRYARRKLRYGNRKRFPSVFRTRRALRRSIRGVVYKMSETKLLTIPVLTGNVSTVPSYSTFTNGITQGTGNDQRIGRNIRFKRMGLKIWAELIGTGAETAYVRVLLLFPRKGIDDTSLLTEVNLLSFSSRPDPNTVITMYDKSFALSRTANGSVPFARHLQFWKRFNYSVQFSSSGIVNREPLFVVLSNLAASNASDVNIFGYLSLSFKDL